MAQFLLSCESTVDVPFAYMHSRGIPVIFYSYIIDEQPYPDDMGRDPEALPRFYAFLDAGKLPSTSQINQFAYYDYFKELLEQGGDVLHIARRPRHGGGVLLRRRARAGMSTAENRRPPAIRNGSGRSPVCMQSRKADISRSGPECSSPATGRSP